MLSMQVFNLIDDPSKVLKRGGLYTYGLEVQSEGQVWKVNKTYGDFRQLYERIEQGLSKYRKEEIMQQYLEDFRRIKHPKRLEDSATTSIVKADHDYIAAGLSTFVFNVIQLHTKYKSQSRGLNVRVVDEVFQEISNLINAFTAKADEEEAISGIQRPRNVNPKEKSIAELANDCRWELQKMLTVSESEMIVKFMDRIITKALMKTSGCYRLVNNELLIDVETMYHDLVATFTALPSHTNKVFLSRHKTWRIPPRTNLYINMKWHQLCGASRETELNSERETKAATEMIGVKSTEDDLSSSDEDLATREENDVLDLLIENGYAGRDQSTGRERQLQQKTARKSATLTVRSSLYSDESEYSSTEDRFSFEMQKARRRKDSDDSSESDWSLE